MRPSPDTTAPLFSIVICTYNRAAMLAEAVQSVLNQKIDPACFEIVVVDNRSVDDTPRVVDDLIRANLQQRIRYLYEAKAGLGAARHAGISIAHGQWIGFLDDDAKAGSEWLATAARNVREQPDLDGMGGPIYPFYLAPRPAWFLDGYEVRTWGEEPRFLKQNEMFSGGNMFFRREFLVHVAPAMDGMGMTGNAMQFGEDTILFERAWKEIGQPKFYYHPSMMIYHAVPARNMRVGYILKRNFSYGVSNYLRNGPTGLKNRIRYLRKHGPYLFRLARIALSQRKAYGNRNNWLVETGRPLAKHLGLLCCAAGLQFRFRQRGKKE